MDEPPPVRVDAPSVWNFHICIYFALGFVVVRYSLDRFVYRKIASWLLNYGVNPPKITEYMEAKILKCSESMWKLTYYGTVEACILAIGYNEPWFTDTSLYFKGWPDQELKLPLKLFYMCQCGFYTYSIAALLFWETRRKDHNVMMSHHVVTVLLIGYSYLTRFFRIGSVVLALHDASDVFLETAKVFKYSGNELAASVIFGFFAVTWIVLRLIYFPFWVIRAASNDLQKYLPLHETYGTLMYYFYNTMLLTLLVFHLYWWVLICAMIKRQLKNQGKVGEDIRSDSDDDA